ncbi:MAG: chorismate mutase [Emcibacteraceae bacterium]|nr:chorismate mutase [Emcibacteraceae bacterium]MDC0081629.1 chorismate mutase [Emcibacteraceae bacterium]MDC1429196.1 chorismate mutase [Emcibacteraceae bacterium]
MSHTNKPIGEEAQSKLDEYRKSIDNIDAAVINMLAERFKITQKVGAHKAKHKLEPADKKRESEQISRLRKLSEDAQLDPNFSEKFLDFIIEEVIHHHKGFLDSE